MVREAADYVKELLPEANITVMPGEFAGDPVEFDHLTPIEEEVGHRSEWSFERGIKETIIPYASRTGLSQSEVWVLTLFCRLAPCG